MSKLVETLSRRPALWQLVRRLSMLKRLALKFVAPPSDPAAAGRLPMKARPMSDTAHPTLGRQLRSSLARDVATVDFAHAPPGSGKARCSKWMGIGVLDYSRN